MNVFVHMKKIQDSGGFQMVSLSELAEVTEEGVKFVSPHDGSLMMLTPEHSIQIQNSIGALVMDILVHGKGKTLTVSIPCLCFEMNVCFSIMPHLKDILLR